jgi:hypothetical protein
MSIRPPMFDNYINAGGYRKQPFPLLFWSIIPYKKGHPISEVALVNLVKIWSRLSQEYPCFSLDIPGGLTEP